MTLHTNVLFGETWKRSAVALTRQFQEEAVRNIRLGYTGADPGVRIWTFSSALMYSITVFTTIGKRDARYEATQQLGIHLELKRKETLALCVDSLNFTMLIDIERRGEGVNLP